jgi:hypothetical protein
MLNIEADVDHEAIHIRFGLRARMHGTQAGRPLDQTADGVAAARKWAEAAGLTFWLVDEAVGDSHGPAPHPEKDPRA